MKHSLETRVVANNLLYMNYMILTLCWITEKEDFHTFLEENDSIRLLACQLIENCIITSKYKLFTDFFARVRARLFSDVLFPLLTTPESEYLKAVDEPKEFMALALDVVDKQDSQTIKTQAAKCIEAFADKVDGCVSFVAMF